MSEPARQTPSHDSALRTPGPAAPLRDWLATMLAAEARTVEPPVAAPVAPVAPEPEIRTWAPRLVTAAKPSEDAEDELSEIMAENMMLKARLRLESDRRDELQIILAQEIRELRSHIAEEVGKMEDLRAERDLWRARCEALAAPLFQTATR
ncbi:hypothetical protein [Methylobacterium sp. Leaf118]|uniref:hypothetical protein n=1 Tax=Methylobacterium sp. Leaf118 TaxID=2876562 RepID=UPI001E5D1086|nr:hypothetical protein [Methylobacterium sp. Leaf118]